MADDLPVPVEMSHEFSVEDCFLSVPRSALTVLHVDRALSEVRRHARHSRSALILCLANVGGIERLARRELCENSDVSAIALLGKGPMDRVIAASFACGGCPVKLVSSIANAVDWLETDELRGRY